MDIASERRYQDLSLIGRGGMGAVFSAHDTLRGETVALKRLQLDATIRNRDERTALFHAEYRTLAELDHPCVIRVYDYGVDAEGPYYTMELLGGSDLSQQAPMPWRQACSLARDVCSSLALLHSRGYVHRDVSPLNVRCTSEARAKLIDFGAMAPMGVSVLTMGTPPCIAPEALRREPLDGRTDLFALGATLYFALSGRHAYPARTLLELRLLHERAPRPTSQLVADLPAALDRLVSSLLNIDPMARPRHAAEVMERLSSIAELAPLEQLAVPRAYLNAPALVAREAATQQLTEGVRRLAAQRGVVLCLRAADGGGRSRLLQVGMTEAQLLGLTVVSAGASDALRGRYGVLRALLTGLRDTLPRARAAIAQSAELRTLLEAAEIADDASSRAAIMKAFSTLLVRLAAVQPLLCGIDDIERCDEPSLAALLTLASNRGRSAVGLLYCAVHETAPAADGALQLLHELSRPIELPALDETQTETLLGSVFGQVPNLATVARYVFERATGNPRGTMALAQALVDRGLARYELGSWSLPGTLAHDALPASLSDARRSQLAELSADARELADILSILESYGLPPEEVVALTQHADPERVAQARHELLAARIVDPLDPQALADRGWVDTLRQSLEPTHAQLLHARLAERLAARSASLILTTRCLLRASAPARALDLLCSKLSVASFVDEGDALYPELLQECLALCETLGRPTRDAFYVRRELVTLADRVIIPSLPMHFEQTLRQLCHDSGLDDWQALGALPDSERLTQALTTAEARYQASPEHERVLGPIDAIRGLVETVYMAAVYAALVGDPQLLAALPSIAPFAPLSLAINGVIGAIDAQVALIGARYEEALESYTLRLARLDGAGLSEAQLARSRPLLHYALGALQAGLGIEGALEHARILDDLPQGQIMAGAVRENYYARRGDARSAEHWRRRRELLQIQQKRPHALKLRQATQQLESSAQADDLEQTKRNLEVLHELAENYPSLSSYLDYGRAEYDRIRGDYVAALGSARLSLDATRPGVHPVWPWAAHCEIDCLRHLKRLDEAHQVGLLRVQQAQAAGLRVMRDHIECCLALVEAELGLFEAAVQRLDRGIAYREQLGMLGLNLGWSYEIRARVALSMRDQAAFEHCMRRCADSFQGVRNNPALLARHEQLLQDARVCWGGMSTDALTLKLVTVADLTSSGHSTVLEGWQSFFEQPDRAARAGFALQQILNVTQCEQGRLYLLGASGPELVAGAPDSPELRALVSRWLGLESDLEIKTITDDEVSLHSVLDSAAVWPVLLSCMRGDVVATAGVVALPGAASEASTQLMPLVRELTRAFIDLGDAQPKLQR